MIWFVSLRLLLLTTVSFVCTLAWTPLLTHVLYRYKLGKQIRDAASAPVFSAMHQKKSGTPTMGGILIWGTTTVLMLIIACLAYVFPSMQDWSFLSRKETLLPLGVLVASALVGLLDDVWNVQRKGPRGGGLRMRHRLLLYTVIAAIGAWWFYSKLERDSIHVPFMGTYHLGLWFVVFFIFVIVATAFSVNETDGLDGLAGGTLLSSFTAFGTIAFLQGRYDLATFCGVLIGALLAFLWFNIHPARFFMGDTGAMSLGVTLGIVALLTNTELLLPVICFVFVVESGSVLLQLFSKKIFKKKLFLSTPIHHHFEAIGWPEPKIVMRLWVISAGTMVVGLACYLLDATGYGS